VKRYIRFVFGVCPDQFLGVEAPFTVEWQGDTLTIDAVRDGMFKWMKEFYIFGKWWNACLIYDAEVLK